VRLERPDALALGRAEVARAGPLTRTFSTPSTDPVAKPEEA
jgi:hypothetical protein